MLPNDATSDERAGPSWRNVLAAVAGCWQELATVGVVFMAVGFVITTPLVSLLFRGFLALSGRAVLADFDIVNFLAHPIGWAALVVVGGANVGVLALEQAALMAISLAAAHGRRLGVLASLRFVAARAGGIFQIAARMVVAALVVVAPFLLAATGISWALLRGHDINFYLSERPPRFWIAAAAIAAVLAALAVLLVRMVVSWAVAVQLYLFERVPPGRCLAASRQRVAGHRLTVAAWVVAWAILAAALAGAATALVIPVGAWLVPAVAGSLWKLLLTLGGVLLLWSASNFVTTLIAVISFAVVQGHVYDRFGRGPDFRLPAEPAAAAPRWRLTLPRLAAGLLVAVLAAALVGAGALHSARVVDQVQITAHRGSSARAPENTLAAALAAIEDRADWVEIDVQESKDGAVVVVHDRDLKRVAGNSARVAELTLEELRALDVGSFFSADFSDQRVATLAEILEACKGRIGVLIELKHYGHARELERRVIEDVEAQNMAGEVAIMSFTPDSVDRLKRLRPDWTIGLLSAVALGDLSRQPADFFAVGRKLATRPFIERVHGRERQVFVWTVNDPVLMSTMISRGADNLITDFPDVARRVLDERATMSPVERLLVELALVFHGAPPESDEE